ncbi:MAG: HAMP domain-containing sensor histidine kinase [Planctomycetota bacterium]
MGSRRTALLVAVLLVSAAGLLVAGLIGLGRAADDAARAADAETLRAVRLTARGLEERLVEPDFLAARPPERHITLVNGGVRWPEALAEAQSVEVAFHWRTENALREAARAEQVGGDPAEARTILARAASEEDIGPRDRARLGLASAFIALRAGDGVEAERELDRSGPSAARDGELSPLALALAADLGREFGETEARVLAALPAERRRALLARLASAPPPGFSEANARAEVLVAWRGLHDRVATRSSELLARDRPAILIDGADLLLWRPTVENAGDAVLLSPVEAANALAADARARGFDLAGGEFVLGDAAGRGERSAAIAPSLALVAPARQDARTGTGWIGGAFVALGLLFVVTLFTTLRALRQEARAAATRADFTTSVTHELKTPLASIRLLAEMLEEDRVPDPERRREYYRRLSGEAARLAMLVENVLDLGRLEGGERAYDRRPVAPDEVVAETLDLFAPLAEREGLHIERRLEGAAASAVADRGALAQVLLNLLDNARKYAAEGHRLVVRSFRDERGHRLEVRDFGPGLPPEERTRVFDRFVRGAREGHGATPGVGLGLYLSRRILLDHGGDLAADAPADGGAGAIFTWTLPESRDDADPGRRG